MNNQPTAHTCAYSTKCEACARPHFETTYEVIDGNNLTPHFGHCPSFATVAEAVAGGGNPFGYVVAVVNGWMRELTAEEEAEFQRCLKLRPHTYKKAG